MTAQHEPIHFIGIEKQNANTRERAASRKLVIGLLRESSREPERRAFAGRASHSDPSAHHVDELLRNCQSQSRAAVLSRR